MSQNIGWRQASRYAANATAPPFGQSEHEDVRQQQEQVDEELEVQDRAVDVAAVPDEVLRRRSCTP